jgi:hypothetical protein
MDRRQSADLRRPDRVPSGWQETMKRSRIKGLLDRKTFKSASIPFHRELSAVQRKYDRMTSALDRKDPARARVIACHLAQAWLRVEIAFIRFIERTPAELGLGRQAKRERLVLSGSNYIVREWYRDVLGEMSTWGMPPDEFRALKAVLCWLHERLGSVSVVGFPDLSAPHVCHFNQPGSHRRAARAGARK